MTRRSLKDARKVIVEVTPAQMVEELSARLCPTEDIATALGIARTTLYDKFANAIKVGHARARNELREWQFNAAKKGNPAILIWLGKQYLGQTDKLPDFSTLTDQQLIALGLAHTFAADGSSGAGEEETVEGGEAN